MDPDTYLYRGLPCVRVGEDTCVIYSPYTGEIIEAPIKSIFEDSLANLDIFGTPASKLLPPDLIDLTLVLTRDCNLRCRYCFAYGGEIKTKMTKEIIETAIDNLLTSKVNKLRLSLTGGEPTAHPQAIKWAIEKVEDKEISSVYIIGTNGVISEDLLRYLISKDFIFSLSVDGLPSMQDYLRPFPDGSGTSKSVERTIRELVKNDMTFRVRTTITESSVKYMPEIVSYFVSLGVERVDFEPLDIWGRAMRENMRENMNECKIKDFVYFFDQALDVAEKKGIKVTSSAFTNLLEPAIYSCPNVEGDRIVVLPDGRISRCCAVLDDTHPLADMFIIGECDTKENKIKITNPEKARYLSDYSVDAIKNCNNCFAKYICSGACPVRHLLGTKSKDIQRVYSYQCDLNKELIKNIILRMWKKVKSAQTD